MRVRTLLAAALSAAAFAACASPPMWVRRTPVLRLLYRPWGQLYLENPKFSFEVKRDWKGPELVDGGVRVEGQDRPGGFGERAGVVSAVGA